MPSSRTPGAPPRATPRSPSRSAAARPSSRRNAPEAPEPPGTAARRAALKLLDAVLRRGEALDRASHSATLGLKGAADRALAIAIAAETLRHLPDLDAMIDGATAQILPDDAKARHVLRLALVQVLKLGTPHHAAVATALPLVSGGPRRLVHGVLGTVLRAEAKLPSPPTLLPDVAARWTASWGSDMVHAAAVALETAPPLDLSLRDTDATTATAIDLYGQSLAPGHIRLPRSGDVTALSGFGDGGWWVQDIAASLPARLIGVPPQSGARALDLCAAPGGKTLQLAAAGWRVTSVDQSEKRLNTLRRNLERTGLSADVITADVRHWTPPALYDAVLLDAPCSATGIFRRHPDVLHHVTDAQIAQLTMLQRDLLARAAQAVAPGGALVYAVCSLEPSEGEDQIRAFLSAHPGWRIVAPSTDTLPAGITALPDGWVRTLPGTLADVGGCDGFFAVKLERK